MSGAVHSLSFQDLIEAVESMPLEDQSMLVELINKRIIEKRQAELVAEVQDARSAFKRIEHALKQLATDPQHISLHTHKLKGDLAGSWACTVDFEYRIVFEFVRDPKTQEEIILLEAVGTHHEVY